MARRIPVDRLKFFDAATHDKLTHALLDIAAQLSARGFKAPKQPDLTAIELDDGSLRISVSAKNAVSRHFDVPAGIWKEMSADEAATPDEPLRPIDPEGLRRALAAELSDRERWYHDNRDRHVGATSALIVFDRTSDAMAKLQQLAEEQPEVAEFVAAWSDGQDELLVIHLAVHPERSAAFSAESVDDLVDRGLARIRASVKDMPRCGIISPSSSPKLERVFQAWEALGGRPVPPVKRSF